MAHGGSVPSDLHIGGPSTMSLFNLSASVLTDYQNFNQSELSNGPNSSIVPKSHQNDLVTVTVKTDPDHNGLCADADRDVIILGKAGSKADSVGSLGDLSFSDQQQPTEPDSDTIKMFVGQVPRSFDEIELKAFFERYGPVYHINVLRDKANGQSKGCCFVTFFHRKDAVAAQCALHNIVILPGMHHPVQMKPADSENKNDRKLFVGMLDKQLTEVDVRRMFSRFGPLEECLILRDANGSSKGCAFVTFASRPCALNAIKELHQSQIMEGCSNPLVVKLADSQKEKEQKKATSGQAMPKQSVNESVANLAAVQMAQSLIAQNQAIGSYLNLLQQAGLGQLNIQQQLALLAQANQNGGISSPMYSGHSIASNLPGLTGLMNYGSNAGLNALTVQNLSALSALNGSSGLTNSFSCLPTAALLQAKSGFCNPSTSSASSASSFPGVANPLSLYSSLNNLLQSQLTSGAVDALPNSLAFNKLGQYSSSNFSGNVARSAHTAAGKQVEGPEGCNLFIYHLPQDFNDLDLVQTFQAFGNVISAKVFVDKHTNLSKCFGFVSYDNALSSHSAIQSMNGFQIGTKRLKVQLKRSKQDAKPY